MEIVKAAGVALKNVYWAQQSTNDRIVCLILTRNRRENVMGN